MCVFVCVVDHGVNEGEPVNEPYCEQENEDKFRDPSPKDRTSPKALKTASSIHPLMHVSVLVFIITTQWPVLKLHMFYLHENTVG